MGLGRMLGKIYWLFARHRREIVIANLLPAFDGNHDEATKAGRQLFQNFTAKLLDLWRLESGLPVEHLFSDAIGWEHIAAALAQRRGILFVTPHLGNWEFGSPIMTRKGVDIHVITQAEPHAALTKLRQISRARNKVQTLVIGEDPFTFVEIIRRLEEGAAVALLVDRPPIQSSVEVELFGKNFRASVAPAELARASGCVVLPVYILRGEKGYIAKVLPAIPYDRAGLRDPKNRREFIQEIMRAFEPVIRQHADQWYQFVPVWPK